MINDGVAFVIFDVPINSKDNVRKYNAFHNNLIKNGYIMYQKSIYYKYLRNNKYYIREQLIIHKIKIDGNIKMLLLTMKEFKNIINISGNEFQIKDKFEILHF